MVCALATAMPSVVMTKWYQTPFGEGGKMKSLRWAFVAVVLATIVAGQVLAREDGCCVCADGRCIEHVRGMGACIDLCAKRQSKGEAYNERGVCWSGGCQRVREMRTDDNGQKGGAR